MAEARATAVARRSGLYPFLAIDEAMAAEVLRDDLLAPKVALLKLAAGLCGCFCFLVIKVTPPFSAGITPTAYHLISI